MEYMGAGWPGPPEYNNLGQTTERVLMPERFDSEWCQLFNQAYGDGSMSACIDADFLLLQNRYKPIDVQNVDLEGLSGASGNIIEGRILGVKLIQRAKEYVDDETIYDPYIMLSDADLLYSQYQITSDMEQQVWVPLKGLEDIVLYPSE
jgi:hypothetical protein